MTLGDKARKCLGAERIDRGRLYPMSEYPHGKEGARTSEATPRGSHQGRGFLLNVRYHDNTVQLRIPALAQSIYRTQRLINTPHPLTLLLCETHIRQCLNVLCAHLFIKHTFVKKKKSEDKF